VIASRRRFRACGALLALVGLVFALQASSAAAVVPLGTINEFRAGLEPNSGPGELLLASDGNLWFTDDAVPAIGRITPSGEIVEFTGALTSASRPRGLVAGPGGYLWFADDESIGRVSLDGTIAEFPLAPGSKPEHLVLGPGGNIWFTESYTAVIGRITASGEITHYKTGLSPRSDPDEMALGHEGDLWFTDDGEPSAIGRVTPSGEITEFSDGLEVEGKPSGIVPGPEGNLWFTDNGKGKAVARITPSGEVSLFTGNLGEECGRGCGPYRIINGPEGDLWFTVGIGGSRGLIGRITPAGITMEFTPELGFGDEPSWLVAAPDGNLWFANSTQGNSSTSWSIGRMTPTGAFSAFSEGLDPESVSDLTVGSDGNVWFVNGPAIGRISIAEPPPTPPAPAPVAAPSPQTGHISVIHQSLPVRRHVAIVMLKCIGAQRCIGKLTISANVKHGHSRARAVAIATSAFSVAPGAVATIKARLRHIAQEELGAKWHRIFCTLTVTQDSPGPAQTVRLAAQLTQAPKHAVHRKAAQPAAPRRHADAPLTRGQARRG
jgi:streptogramin lyase